MKLGFLRRVIPLLFLFCAIHARSTHVRTKRTAGLAGFADPYALSDALGAIERERRRLQKEDLLQEQLLVPSSGGYYLPELDELQTEDPDSMRELLQYEETKNDPYRLMSEYRSRDRYPAFSDFNGEDFPSVYSGYDSGSYAPQKRTSYHPQRVTPTMEELEQIFSSANVPMKRTVPVKRRIYATQTSEDDESSLNLNTSTEDEEDPDSDETSENTGADDKAELARKMTSLLEAAEKLEMDDEDASTEEEDETQSSPSENSGGLTDAQLDDIFSASNTAGEDVGEQGTDDDEGNSIEEEDDPSDPEETRPDAVEKLIDEYVSQSKSKRMAKRDNRSPDVSNLLEQIANLKNKLSRVQLLRILEDKENSYLANALEYGTINQIEDKPAYLETEFENIEKATEIEAIMQLLSAQERDTEEYNEAMNLLQEYLNIGDDDDDDFEEEADVIPEKRGEPDTAPGQAKTVDEWYNSPVKDSVSSDSDGK